MGHESWLYVGRKVGDLSCVLEIPRVPGVPGLKRLSLKLEKRLGLQYLYEAGFRKLIRNLPDDTDVLHIHSLHGATGYADIAALPALSRRFPCVMYLKDMWLFTGHCGNSIGCERWRHGCGKCPDLTLFPPITRDATRWNWRRKRLLMGRIASMHLAAPSQWLADRIKASGFLSRCPTKVIPNGIDLRVFGPGDRRTARKALGLPPNGVVVMLGAKDLSSPFKAIGHAITAINGLGRGSITALVVGEDARQVSERLAPPVVTLAYRKKATDMAMCYQAADVLLMPSLGETFGLVAAEAMACGCAVLAYATGGLPEVIGDDGAGVLVPTGDIDALTKTLAELVRDRARIATLGSKAAKRAKRCFSVRLQAERFLDLYREAIAARQSS